MKILNMIAGTLVLGALFLSCEKNEFEPDARLIAYYPFDGTALDASGNGHDGIVHGAELTADRNGKTHSAFYFDGNISYIDLGNSHELKRYMSDYSVSGWIWIDSYPPTYNSIIMSNRNPNDPLKPGSFIGIGGLQSSLSKRVEYVQNTVPSEDEYTFDFVSSNTQADLDTWYFFCITYEYNGNLSNIVRIYMDGNLESQKFMGEILDPGNINTYLGCEPELAPVEYSFHGSMDDIRIYDGVLSEEEVRSLYSD